jgi:hypothetical protein
LVSAKITAIFHFLPILLPLLSPAKRPVANKADFLREIGLADVLTFLILHC